MSDDSRHEARKRTTPTGPGVLVLVVGPSGAGKDTLIGYAWKACHDDRDVVFPRRVITRAATDHEDHDTLGDAAFDQALANGAFAFWWTAHGLKYGLPVSIDADIRHGRTVVCNVSRAIVPALRARYARTRVVLVTAPAAVLAARLEGRQRATDGPIGERLDRAALVADRDLGPDATIENTASPDVGGKQLLDAIRGRTFVVAL